MRSWAPVLAFLLLAACEPASDPNAPAAESKPCQTDDDCQIRGGETSVRQGLCASHIASSASHAADEAECGPISNMSARAPEPVLACFRGTCVPLKATKP